jgi:hypothetical protein
MAFPSTIGSTREDKQTAWLGARDVAGTVKLSAQQVRALSADGALASSNLLTFATVLADAQAQLQRYATIPGMQRYVQDQLDTPGFDLAAEMTALLALMDACRTWILTNFPQDTNGFVLAQTFAADGRQRDRVFTAAQTAGLRGALDALIATID